MRAFIFVFALAMVGLGIYDAGSADGFTHWFGLALVGAESLALGGMIEQTQADWAKR